MADIDVATQYYKDLMLYQYQDKPKASGTIDLLIRNALCDLVILQIRDGFSLETAIGKQLDILGKYIGFSRTVLIPPIRDFFTFATYEFPAVAVTGFIDYAGGVNVESFMYTYEISFESFTDLEDEEYRFLLKLKVLLNLSDNSLASITSILFQFFGADLICNDQANMTVTYTANINIKRLVLLAQTQELLPKPQGVEISNIIFV